MAGRGYSLGQQQFHILRTVLYLLRPAAYLLRQVASESGGTEYVLGRKAGIVCQSVNTEVISIAQLTVKNILVQPVE